MTKSMTVVFGSFVIAATLYGALAGSVILSFLLDTRLAATGVRVAIVALVVAYCFLETLRHKVVRSVILGLGIGLISLALASIIWTDALVSAGLAIRLLDAFFALEWGIISILVAVERPIASNTPRLPKFDIVRPRVHSPTAMHVHPV